MTPTLVHTPKGMIDGIQNDGYRTYYGVRYAQAPVGELRFRTPRETDPWEGVYKADRFGARCPQEPNTGFYRKEFYSDPAYAPEMSEDCLFLNLWVPDGAEAGRTKCPVAFWIHGGAFDHGWSSELEFDGAEYARRGVILVTVNYRLGVLGFLAHPWLSVESEWGASGNYGILDQTAALKWVRDNISCFGGDPDNITVFGQSAGAMSTQTLCSSPLTKGMIAKAILQSGGSYGVGLHSDITQEQAMRTGTGITDALGVNDLSGLRKLSVKEILCGFRAYMAREIAAAGGDYSKVGLKMLPIIDGHVLTKGYYEVMDAGELHDIPYMIGSTADDIMVTDEDKAAGRKGGLYEGALRFSFKEEEKHGAPAYVYYFRHKLPGDDAGAFHSAELWYMFGTLGRAWRPMTDADRALSGRMLDNWTDFCKYGDPNGDKNAPGYGEKWRKCAKNDPYVETFDI